MEEAKKNILELKININVCNKVEMKRDLGALQSLVLEGWFLIKVNMWNDGEFDVFLKREF